MSLVRGGLADTDIAAAEVPPSDDGSQRFVGAFELLESASKALEFLQVRRTHLESAVEEVSRRAEAAVAISAERAAAWKRLEADLDARNAALQRQVAALVERAERAEAERQQERARAEAAERRTAETEHLLRGLHDKVLSAFGRGTRAFDILSDVPGEATSVVRLPKRTG